MRNLIIDTDSYKVSHFEQYPPGTTSMYSYVESRGGKYQQTVFFGLQYLLKEYLSKPITMEMVDEANEFFSAHGLSFNYAGWKGIVTKYGGKLPVRIRAVPEGTVVPTGNLLMDVESTGDSEDFWVVSWLETMLLRVWYPITVATQSWHIKAIIKSYLEKTSTTPDEIAFKLHDFGSRGVSSRESAAIGGAAHLVNFMGSDTCAGVFLANKYYKHPMAGFSIPAAEHSSITSWGRENEVEAYRNMLAKFAKPGSLVAVVSDSYDLYNAVSKHWGEALKDQVVASGATVVIRPDSGNPVEVVTKCLKLLDEKYGSSYNAKGYKVLNNVRVIQGDGINEESIRQILESITAEGFSATNVAFGMGGALLQQVNRDTQRFAFKCSQIMCNGKSVDVFKDPVTDPGKRSKRGKLDLVYSLRKYETKHMGAVGSVMHTVYENGEILKEYTLDQVRANASRSQDE